MLATLAATRSSFCCCFFSLRLSATRTRLAAIFTLRLLEEGGSGQKTLEF